jgi:hypothetical protein
LAASRSNGILDNFRFYYASHINRAVEGFLFLRRSGRFDSARLLVRPAIEAMIRLLAVRKRPESLYQLMRRDRAEYRKWTRPVCIKFGDTDYDARDEQAWERFKKLYAEQLPQHEMVEHDLTLFDAANAAEIGGYYDSHYRLYCNYTHASLHAIMGSLEPFETEDSRAISLCAFSALEDLVMIKAEAPQFDVLRERLSVLLQAHGPGSEAQS